MILQEKTVMLIDYQTFLMYNTNRRNLKMEIVNGMKIYRNVDEIKNILSDNRKIEQLNLHPIVKDLLLNADKQKLLANVNNHIAKISNHYFYVKNFCEQAGIPERGKSHDISKFSEEELFESIYFYEGTRSPIDKANEVIGWSPAFAHHIKYNDHQLENSIYINGGMIKPVEKTLDASIEVVCDFCGAAKAYLGSKFSFVGELTWWYDRLKILELGGTIHPKMAEFITQSLALCAEKDQMINYEDFQNIWNGLHNEQTKATQFSVADDVLNGPSTNTQSTHTSQIKNEDSIDTPNYDTCL